MAKLSDEKRTQIEVDLALTNKSQPTIARRHGVSKTSVGRIATNDPQAIDRVLQDKRQRLQDIAYDRVLTIFEAVTPEVIKKLAATKKLTTGDLRNLYVSSGILLDKAQMLSGEPTERIERSPREINAVIVNCVKVLRDRGEDFSHVPELVIQQLQQRDSGATEDVRVIEGASSE